MFNIANFLTTGLKNTILFRNNSGMSFNGPWKQVYADTVLDRWHVGDFSAVEYTISADLDVSNKEIIKVLVSASVDTASVVVYARNHTVRNLITISATVNSSYVDVVLNPAITDPADQNNGVKVIYTAQYFQTQNPLIL